MFRFTIRELILLTVIVAMGAAWWVDHKRISDQDRTMLKAIKAMQQKALANKPTRVIHHP